MCSSDLRGSATCSFTYSPPGVGVGVAVAVAVAVAVGVAVATSPAFAKALSRFAAEGVPAMICLGTGEAPQNPMLSVAFCPMCVPVLPSKIPLNIRPGIPTPIITITRAFRILDSRARNEDVEEDEQHALVEFRKFRGRFWCKRRNYIRMSGSDLCRKRIAGIVDRENRWASTVSVNLSRGNEIIVVIVRSDLNSRRIVASFAGVLKSSRQLYLNVSHLRACR